MAVRAGVDDDFRAGCTFGCDRLARCADAQAPRVADRDVRGKWFSERSVGGLFFTARRPDWALIEVGFLWLSILLPMIVVGRYSNKAGLLLVPYLAWVSFAAFLNYTIVQLNGPFGAS
jgi:hypothetical protein